MKHTAKWIAGTVAALGGVGYAALHTLLSTALDREPPALYRLGSAKLTGGFNETDIYQSGAAAAKDLRSRPMERVTITARDGVELVGHWYPCKNAKRVVLAMHGWRSSWYRDFGASCDFWRGEGCSILYAEQRGQGESGGEVMGFGITERFDCIDWLRFLEGRAEGLPIYLGGISMGATTVLLAAGLGLPESVHGIMADCGFTSPEAIWRHVAEDNLHVPYALLKPAVERICRRKIGCGPGDTSTVEALKNCHTPVIFIHGTEDSFVPAKMTVENYDACAGEKRLLLVPGAEHGVSYLVDREGYEEAVRAFWRDFD